MSDRGETFLNNQDKNKLLLFYQPQLQQPDVPVAWPGPPGQDMEMHLES